MDLKEIIVQALKNIIHRQSQLNMNSRFIFMRVLKEVNLKASIGTLIEMMQIKFVKDKSYNKILDEMKKLARNEEFRSLENCISAESSAYENHFTSKYLKNINGSEINKNLAVPKSLEDIDVNKGLGCIKTPADFRAIDFNLNSETSMCESEADSYLEKLRRNYGNNFIYSQDTDRIECKDENAKKIEDEVYSDSSIIICNQLLNNEPVSCEEDIFNSMSDLKLEESNFKTNRDKSLIKEAKKSKKNESAVAREKFSISNKNDTPTKPSTTINKAIRKGSRSRVYTPAYKSVPYAIMKALNAFNGSHKHAIILKISTYLDLPHEDLKASSALKLLIKKQLIYTESDLKYYLTKSGLDLCKILFKNEVLLDEGSSEVRIVIDSREKRDTRDRNYFQSYFNSRNIPNVTRFLSLGDFLWLKGEKICRCIVERKQCTDFVASISDGRYKEQKNRLSGLDMTVFYLIENLQVEDAKSNYVQRCMLETRLNGFVLLETENISESAHVLELIDNQVREMLRRKNGKIDREDGSSKAVDSRFDKDLDDECSGEKLDCSGESLCKTYGSFIEDTNKNNLKVSDMLLMALLGIKGLSKDLAMGLAEKYQSLKNFRDNLNKQELKMFKCKNREIGDKLIDKMIRLLK